MRAPAAVIAKRLLTVLAVVVATAAGAYAGLATYGQSRELSVGQVALSADPGHRGALDLYVPLVDWGVRFEDVILTGHTHAAAIERSAGVTVLNGGSVGAGGTGNLAEPTDIGIARLIYTAEPRFQPLAADLVEIDPGTGSATARRERLDAERADDPPP